MFCIKVTICFSLRVCQSNYFVIKVTTLFFSPEVCDLLEIPPLDCTWSAPQRAAADAKIHRDHGRRVSENYSTCT